MTEKKKFEKPSMQVIELQQRTMLLAGSNPAPAPNSASEEIHLYGCGRHACTQQLLERRQRHDSGEERSPTDDLHRRLWR